MDIANALTHSPELYDLQILPFTLEHSSEEDREKFVTTLIENMDAGYLAPVHVHVQLKNIENIIKRLTDKEKYPRTAMAYSRLVNDHAELFGRKTFHFGNADLLIKDMGGRYDFTVCGDPVWNALNAQMEAVKAAMKQREEFLKTVSPGGEIITDKETGETVTIFPAVKRGGSETLTVTLK